MNQKELNKEQLDLLKDINKNQKWIKDGITNIQGDLSTLEEQINNGNK